jgi:hypothetical protein
MGFWANFLLGLFQRVKMISIACLEESLIFTITVFPVLSSFQLWWISRFLNHNFKLVKRENALNSQKMTLKSFPKFDGSSSLLRVPIEAVILCSSGKRAWSNSLGTHVHKPTRFVFGKYWDASQRDTRPEWQYQNAIVDPSPEQLPPRASGGVENGDDENLEEQGRISQNRKSKNPKKYFEN